MGNYCFWSIGDNAHGEMLQTLVHSFRVCGETADFHAFSDREIEGATTHKIKHFSKKHYLFKLAFLKEYVSQLDYDFSIFLDADNYFVRQVSPVFNALLLDTPVHLFFESDCTVAGILRNQWRGCPLPEYVRLMREGGVLGDKIYNVNAGFFVVRREAIELVCGLAHDFWQNALRQGYLFTEEGPLAYAAQLLCQNPQDHLLQKYFNIWGSDWKGYYADRIPDGQDWVFTDYMSGKEFLINPAIVHAIRSKAVLSQLAKKGLQTFKLHEF